MQILNDVPEIGTTDLLLSEKCFELLLAVATEQERSLVERWQKRGAVPSHQKSSLEFLLAKYEISLELAEEPDLTELSAGHIEMYRSIRLHSGPAAAARYLAVIRQPAGVIGHQKRRRPARHAPRHARRAV